MTKKSKNDFIKECRAFLKENQVVLSAIILLARDIIIHNTGK